MKHYMYNKHHHIYQCNCVMYYHISQDKSNHHHNSRFKYIIFVHYLCNNDHLYHKLDILLIHLYINLYFLP